MCQQTVLRFCIALKETFSNSIRLTMINKCGKGAVVQIANVFAPVFNMLLVEGSSETGVFRHLSNHFLRIR